MITVSDTHLGYEQSDSTNFLKFINSELMNLSKNDKLVLLGDILEFWRGRNIDAIFSNDSKKVRKNNEEIFSIIMELNKKTNVYYIIGNHDYTVINFLYNYNKNFQDNKYPLDIRKFIRLKDGNLNMFFIHGYQFEVISSLEPLTIEEYERICTYLCDRTGNLIGKKLSFLWDLYTNSLNLVNLRRISLSKIGSITKPPEKREENINKIDNIVESTAFRQLFFGIKDDEYLVFGHTHRPFKNLDKKVLNCGSWLKYAERHNSYVKIENEKVELIYYK